MWYYALDRAGSGQGQVAGTCECGNELSGFIKYGVFLDWQSTGQIVKPDCVPVDYVVQGRIVTMM